MAPLVRTGGSRHTGLAAPPHRNIQEHGLTKANYYYRLRRVREACLELCEPSPSFVELTAPADGAPGKDTQMHFSVAAVLHAGGITIDICSDASPEFLRNLMGAVSHA